ncbi:MAG: DNA-binding protein [Peptoniphilaceae bacterium]
MEYKDIRNTLEEIARENLEDLTKAIIGLEKGIDEKNVLDEIYQKYMDNDSLMLLNDEFDYMIDEMREQGKIQDLDQTVEERDDLINLVGNIVGQVETLERENANGDKFEVSNFSLVSKDDEGNKLYTNCSAYGDKSKDVKDLKQGDFIKVFGQVRTSIDNNGKEYTNVRILSSKLLKAKKHMKGQDKDKKSILGQIKGFQKEDELKPKVKDGRNKGAER